jgi:hypothetical protein
LAKEQAVIGFGEQSQVLRVHALVVQLLQHSYNVASLGGRSIPLCRYRRERRMKTTGAQGSGQAVQVSVGQCAEGVHQTTSPRKKSAPSSSTVGTTRARSRKSLCCSQDVSAISRQPWQAAPCRNRYFSGEDVFASYDVLLEEGRYSCECLGFLRHGHCKHGDSLSVLQNSSCLPEGNQPPKPAPKPSPRPAPRPAAALNPLDTCRACRRDRAVTDDGLCLCCGDMAADHAAQLADHAEQI